MFQRKFISNLQQHVRTFLPWKVDSLLAQHADCIANLWTLNRSKRRTHVHWNVWRFLIRTNISTVVFQRATISVLRLYKNSIIVFLLSELLKESLTRDFRLQVFSWISFPRAPEYTTGAISNFYENMRRFSKLKVINGVNDNGDYLSPVPTPAINTKLRISPRIFVKYSMRPQQVTQGPGENWYMKKPEVKNFVSDFL